MTEAELLEAGILYWSNFTSQFGIAITIITSYLIAVGAALSTSQISIINFIYIGTMTTVLIGLVSGNMAAIELEVLAWEMTTQRTVEPAGGNFYAGYIVSAFIFFGVIASLKFMWDIRHKK